MKDIENKCESCPYKNEDNFNRIKSSCEGIRINIEEYSYWTRNEEVIGEVARIACGSTLGPDKDISSISIEEWANTPLRPSQLSKRFISMKRED